MSKIQVTEYEQFLKNYHFVLQSSNKDQYFWPTILCNERYATGIIYIHACP